MISPFKKVFHEPRFEYPTAVQKSVCDLEVWENSARVVVVIFTELKSNPGFSVTNSAEFLVSQVFRLLTHLQPDPADVYFIERYDHRSYGGQTEVQLAQVRCSISMGGVFHDPQWFPLKSPLDALLAGEVQCRSCLR